MNILDAPWLTIRTTAAGFDVLRHVDGHAEPDVVASAPTRPAIEAARRLLAMPDARSR